MRTLLASERFRNYCLAKLCQLTGQNALIYGLFILVIEKQETSLSTSLFLLCSVLPGVLLSIPGGVVADATPRKPMLVLSLLLRMAIIVAFIRFDFGILFVLALTVLVWAVWEFYSPAESSALQAVAPPELMTHANAIMYIVSLLAQFVGAGFIAPAALRLLGEDGLFFMSFLLILAGAWFWLLTPHLTPRLERPPREGVVRSLSLGLRFFRDDDLAARAMLQHVLLGAATSMVIVALPRFLSDVLGTGVINAVYIFSPAAVGIAVGLAVAPLLTRLLGGATVTLLGFVACSAGLFALAWVNGVRAVFESQPAFAWAQDALNIDTLVVTTMLIVPLVGLGIALVNIASRALLYERAEGHEIGQLFATQSAIAAVASIIPTLAAGVLVDIVDPRVFLGAVGGLMLVSLVPLLRYGRARGQIGAGTLMQDEPGLSR